MRRPRGEPPTRGFEDEGPEADPKLVAGFGDPWSGDREGAAKQSGRRTWPTPSSSRGPWYGWRAHYSWARLLVRAARERDQSPTPIAFPATAKRACRSSKSEILDPHARPSGDRAAWSSSSGSPSCARISQPIRRRPTSSLGRKSPETLRGADSPPLRSTRSRRAALRFGKAASTAILASRRPPHRLCPRHRSDRAGGASRLL